MPPIESTPEDAATAPTNPEFLQRTRYTLQSAFQPIYSLSHRRLVGHEALLRPRDEAGRAISPAQLFAKVGDGEDRRSLDAQSSRIHLSNFASAKRRAEWLFLNVDASAFLPGVAGRAPAQIGVAQTMRALGVAPQQVAIELLEAELPDTPDFEVWTNGLKRRGFLLAIDDFGAGQSNFDRVFRLRPHIVKLDRGVIQRAGRSATVRRAMTQMIALLHECQALVVVEGVETSEEAEIALDADAEFVQGYHFGRPAARMHSSKSPNRALLRAWERCDERSRQVMRSYRDRVRAYGEALMAAMAALQSGASFREACAGFLALPSADICFLLDENGAQVVDGLLHKRASTRRQRHQIYAPLLDVSSARWSRRPYFHCAMTSFGLLQITRPYPTMHSRSMSVTFSVAFTLAGRPVVLCGDKLWGDSEEHPIFGMPAPDPVF